MSTSSITMPFRPGTHSVRPIPFKAHKIHDFSAEILEAHYEDIYGAAIRDLNNLELNIAGSDVSTLGTKVRENQNALEVRLVNEILLHEVYFDSIGESGGEKLQNAALGSAICAAFSDLRGWHDECLRVAAEHVNKDGWIVLAWSERSGRLLNLVVSDTSRGLFGVQPLVALDLCAHAYIDHFGNQPAAYAEAFLKNIDWQRVGSRFDAVCSGGVSESSSLLDDTQITVDELKALIDRGTDEPLVLDVRHDDDRERYRKRVMQTDWRDSFKVEQWAGDLAKDRDVVVYCMYGFWVSQKVAEQLRSQGFSARSLSGGVTAWRAMGYSSTDNVF